MQPSDFSQFQQHWLAGCEVAANPHRPSDLSLTIIFNDLLEYPVEWVIFALSHHRRTNKFAPVVADIIDIIKDHSGQKHLSADEAWQLALQSFDETKTVIWTKEIAQARAEATQVYAEAGAIQAWKTFKAAYERILKTTHTPPVMIPCYGSDKQDRVMAVEQAVFKNQLPGKTLEALKIEHKPAAVTFLQLADMSAEKDKQTPRKRLSDAFNALFQDDKTAFANEVENLRKHGRDKQADEAKKTALEIGDDKQRFNQLLTRLRLENLRLDGLKEVEKRKAEMREKAGISAAELSDYREKLSAFYSAEQKTELESVQVTA